jgi:hypothetical protein
MNRLQISTFGLMLGLTACGARSAENGTDSSTHWLSSCTDANDCGGGLECICGTCTKACGADSACESLDTDDAVCVDSVCGAQTGGGCTRTCDNDDDCPKSLACSSGVCQLRLTCESEEACLPDGCDGGRCEESTSEAGVQPSTSTNATAASDSSSTTETSGSSTTDAASDVDQTTTSVSTGPDADSSDENVLCPAMRAESSGDGCLRYDGAAWNGSSCEIVNCGCVGADCDAMYETLEQCQNERAACTDAVPTCAEIGFPLVDLDPGFTLQHPTYDFRVEANDDGSGADAGGGGADAGTTAAFEEWTVARWDGWLPLPVIPGVCPGIRGNEDAACPVASRLQLDVAGQPVYIDVTYLWAGTADYYEPSQVEFRIEQGRELEVRELSTQEPVLFVGQNDNSEVERWNFGRLNVRVGAPTCQARNEVCNWLQTVSGLLIGVDKFNGEETEPFVLGLSTETALGAYETQVIEARLNATETARYEVGHSASFSGWSAALGDESCASASPPRTDGFFIHRLK